MLKEEAMREREREIINMSVKEEGKKKIQNMRSTKRERDKERNVYKKKGREGDR